MSIDLGNQFQESCTSIRSCFSLSGFRSKALSNFTCEKFVFYPDVLKSLKFIKFATVSTQYGHHLHKYKLKLFKAI